MRDAFLAGIRAAKLAYLGQGLVDKSIGGAKWVAFGQAPNVFTEGPKTFQPGGTMHWRNILWPTMPGQPGRQALGRAGTVLGTAAALPAIMRQDPNEGSLSRLLGGVGGVAGMMYGGTAGGLLGTPVGMAAGHRLGVGLGHLLGSRPKVDTP